MEMDEWMIMNENSKLEIGVNALFSRAYGHSGICTLSFFILELRSEGMDANDGFEEDIPMIGIGVEVPEHAVDVYQPVAAYEELSDDDEPIAAPLPVALDYPMDVEHEIELNDEDQDGNRSPEPQDVEQHGAQNFLG